MKFTVLQTNFQKALNQVSRVVGTRTTLPVLSNVLIVAEKGNIKLSATDLEVAITAQTKGKVEEDGQLTVPARLLSDFVSNNSDESIEFETKDSKIHLKSKHYKADINGLSAEEFPTVPSLPKDLNCSIPKAQFIEGLKKVIISPANDETRPVLSGVYFQFKKNELVLAATDSYRLSEKKIELEKGDLEKNFIVPARTMTEILRLLGNSDAENIAISSTENQIAFVIGDTQVVSRLIEGAFPNYSQIIPADPKINILVGLKELVSAVKMSALFSKDSANNIKLKAAKGTLMVLSASSEAGNASSEIEAEVTGGEVQIAFNSRYVQDVLSVLSDDKVILQLNDSASSGVIKSPKDDNFIYIVMPLRIDN